MAKKKIILIDQDGPLADFEKGFLCAIKKENPEIKPTTSKNFEVYENFPPEFKNKIEKIYRKRGFFKSLPPVKNGIKAIKEIEKLGYDVFICTSPLRNHKYCVMEKLEWIEKYLGKEFTNKVIFTRDKTVIKGTILIDDKPKIHGKIKKPNWEHIIFDAPYNKDINNKRRLKRDWSNWKKIITDV